MTIIRGLQAGLSATSVQPGVKDRLRVDATVKFAPTSTDIAGTGLWRLALYGAKNIEGTGDHFQRVEQTLSEEQQSQPLIGGADISFVDAYGEMDFTGIGCGEFRFWCLDFMKGENPSPDFEFTSLQEDSSKFTVCDERPCTDGGL